MFKFDLLPSSLSLSLPHIYIKTIQWPYCTFNHWFQNNGRVLTLTYSYATEKALRIARLAAADSLRGQRRSAQASPEPPPSEPALLAVPRPGEMGPQGPHIQVCPSINFVIWKYIAPNRIGWNSGTGPRFPFRAVADPEFSRKIVRGRELLTSGRKLIIWQDSCRTLHGNRRKLDRGGRPRFCYVDPPPAENRIRQGTWHLTSNACRWLPCERLHT